MTIHRLIFTISLLFIVLVGYVDHTTGGEVSMLLLYAVPILLASRYCGRHEGLVVAAGAAASWLTVNVAHRLPNESGVILSWNAFTRLGIFLLIAYTVSLQAKLRILLRREKLRADTDLLTGLLNKGAFREQVEEEMTRARRYNHPMSLAFLDLDDFKKINDTHGHAHGDRLLQQVSNSIIVTIRKTDIAGRIGGDEFTICFTETGESQARKAVEKLVKALETMFIQSGWQVTASIGVVTCTKGNCSYDALMGKADKLMYVAKEKGKNAAEYMTI